MKIAFVSLGSFGDCLNSTFMVDALKNHYQGCTIDLYTTDLYGAAFDNHPDIAGRTVLVAKNKLNSFELYAQFAPRLREHFVPDIATGILVGYDLAVMPCPFYQPAWWDSKQHPELGKNIICCFMRNLEEMGIPYEWPLNTKLYLRPQEVERARGFVSNIAGKRILMEVHGESGQTFWNDNWTLRVGRYLLSDRSRSLIVSCKDMTPATRQLIAERPGRVWFAGGLSIRECVEVYNNCHAFLSVSSGLSCACNTNWARRDTIWVETTANSGCTSAPLRSTGKIFWHDNNIDKYIKTLGNLPL